MQLRTNKRAGFTLIEIMIAMALTLFIMVILSQAFVTSLDTFSGAKGIGDMQQFLRTADVMIRTDLGHDHFEGKRRLSDLNPPGSAIASQIVTQPPQAGFFAVRRGPLGAAYVWEGADASGLPSYRAIDHVLYMTVKLKGNRQENFFNASLVGQAPVLGTFFSQPTAYNLLPTSNALVATTDLPNSTLTTSYNGGTTGYYSSQWAEVLYYLVRTGSTEQPLDPTSTLGTPTFGLYRAQFVMVPDGTNVSGKIANGSLGTFAGLSCNPGAAGLTFYSPADAATVGPVGLRVIPTLNPVVAALNLDPASGSPTAIRVFAGATLVCPNVVSFQLQLMQHGSAAFDDMSVPGAVYYDTTKFGTAGYTMNFGLKGIQATLRVWDSKTRQTRQITVVQDL